MEGMGVVFGRVFWWVMGSENTRLPAGALGLREGGVGMLDLFLPTVLSAAGPLGCIGICSLQGGADQLGVCPSCKDKAEGQIYAFISR